ncbi:hypothetical protein CCR75_000048 [Bremia lactucae]|uniref:Uncharacterized protein n=1 Tax=Bremia lactucae TaxID=4779 RepID=A0A976FIT2_BRELC|nr:hypothetical protein CCR75_000048 [Bremia lactucae]
MTDKVVKTKAVVFISDASDDHDASIPCTQVASSPSSSIVSDSDSDVKLEEMLNYLSSNTKIKSIRKSAKLKSPPRTKKKVRSCSITTTSSLEKTPVPALKRRASEKSVSSPKTPPASRSSKQKPITPSSTQKSSMNASLVFDMVTSLSTNDPGVAIATLRSIVVLGKEYPSNLLYAELIDRIQSHEAIVYKDAVAIYAALVFVFDKAISCSCALTFPNKWEPLATALQEVSGNGRVKDDGMARKDETWRRHLLVVQFFIYCFQKDMVACRSRYESFEGKSWMFHTRLSSLLQTDAITSKARKTSRINSTKLRNNAHIISAIGWGLQLWKRVYDEEAKETLKKDTTNEACCEMNSFLQQEGEQACMAVVRLIEMLYMCTDQHVNALQRIQAGLGEFTRPTCIKFAQSLQSPALRTELATTMIGLSNKARSTEIEWYECNALGRVQLAMKSDTSSDLAHTDGYSWSHFDSFITMQPQNNFTKLLQEISRLQHD